ncbi:MAG: hypothetical protein ACJA0H_000764 [Francisellaceae bacterium]|jgi:hypothetical protein
MDKIINVVSLDWRKFGDYSAVGQLTQKIFSIDPEVTVFPVQCIDGLFCNVFTVTDDGKLQNVFETKVKHDAVQNYIRKLDVSAFYVRLSPHIGVLELACKIAAVQSNVPLIVHYMDKPSFSGMSPSRVAYIKEMYRFLTLRADSVYTIHASSLTWLHDTYDCKASVLANFIKTVPELKFDLRELQERPIHISYFGSVDSKMNDSALFFFCRLISNCSWIKLSIWTNSHISNVHDLSVISNASCNIDIFKSNLDEASFKLKLEESDLLLIAYNQDAEVYLKHSFSNKYVDYLEVGGVILCLGPIGIPTVKSCREIGVSLVFENEAEMVSAFESKEVFLNLLSELDLEQYVDRLQELQTAQLNLTSSFFEDIKRLSTARLLTDRPGQNSEQWTGNAIQMQQLAFLIRRKFYDLARGQQSLSATLMAETIRAKGYKGFDYEI